MPLSINTYPPPMSDNLTKREIVLKIFTEKGYPQKHIRDSVQLTLDAISEALLSGRDVELRNFGVFQVQVRKSRIGRNPNKPEAEVVIPQRAVVKFRCWARGALIGYLSILKNQGLPPCRQARATISCASIDSEAIAPRSQGESQRSIQVP